MMAATIDLNPELASCTPNEGGQEAFAEDWENQYVALEGGWGSGKTWAGARKLVTLHMWNAFDSEGRATFVASAAIAPTIASARDYMVPHLSDALDEAGLRWDWRMSAQEFIVHDLGTSRRPSIIMVRSADKPERITGWEVGAAWGDEPARWSALRTVGDPTRDPLLQLSGRVRHPKARFLQILYTYTNEGDTTAVYKLFHSGKPGHKLYRAKTSENPVSRAFGEAQRAQLTPDLARQYLDGDALPMRGQSLYPPFDADVHVRDDLVLADSRPLHLSLDFNIAPGMHAEIGQYDTAADVFITVDEIHGPRMDVIALMGEFGRRITELGGFKWPELQVFADQTGGSRWAGTGESCHEILRQCLEAQDIPYRMRIPRHNPMVTDRLNAVNMALSDVKGEAHWYCAPRCVRLIEDLRSLCRDAQGKVDKREADLSHASDAEGYRVHYLRPARRLRLDQVGGRISV